MLIALAAIWGSSFMFIKVVVRQLHPEALVFGRLAFAVLALALALLWSMRWQASWQALRADPVPLLVTAIFNSTIPFWLLAWGETHIDSGLAALLQASAPLFTAIFAFWFVHSERVSGPRLFGVVTGFAGVALLVGATPSGSVLAALGIVATGACYAASALYAGRRLGHVPPIAVAFWTTALAALVSAPAGLARLPSGWPGWKAFGSVVALGVLGLGVAYLLYFALISEAGASRAILVTYLVPSIALLYGAAVLDESVGASDVAGLLLILAGVTLGVRRLRTSRAPVAG
jgi:drug/metabolite transporter (DMT)-like permease